MPALREEILADGVRLICGDCREIVPTLGKVDAVISDPPYEQHMHTSRSGARGIRNDGYAAPKPLDFVSIDGMRTDAAEIMVAACRKWMLVFCTPEGVAPWRDAIEIAGARYKRACFGHKPNSAPQFNGQGPAMAVEAFVAAWCGQGYSAWNGGWRRNLFTHNTNGHERHGGHPTEKPIALMRELVCLFSDHRDVILDPFMGSGSTGVAAVQLGRKFIGVEIEPKYFDIARRRIADELARPRFDFGEPALRAKQESLL